MRLNVISKKAITEYRERKLRNFDWMKKLSEAEIDQALSELDPPPDFSKLKRPMWLHQKVCFLVMAYLERFMCFLDMGAGKTLIILLLIEYAKQCGFEHKAIVFVPFITAIDTWIEEVEKSTSLKCVPLLGSSTENLNTLLTAEGDVFVACYASAVAMVCDRIPSRKKRGKQQLKLEASKVRKYFASFNFIGMDESHKIKNKASLTFRMCWAIATRCQYAFAMTGTPFGRDLEALWAQLFVVDGGETLGDTIGMYRAAMFTEKPNFWGGGFKYTFIKKLLPLLRDMIKNSSLRYEIEECITMPPKKNILKLVNPTPAIRAYYNPALERLQKITITNKGTYHKAEGGYNQLRQLTSGFMTVDGSSGGKVAIELPDNPKIDALLEIIDLMPLDSKLICFHHYQFTNAIISKALTKIGMGHARVWGGAKDQLGELRRFKTDPKCRVLVINDQSGSSSLNLQNANYIVFFEEPSSSIDWEQAKRRAWRPGQLKRVFIYSINMRGTADVKLHRYNKEGRDLLQNVLDGKEKLKAI